MLSAFFGVATKYSELQCSGSVAGSGKFPEVSVETQRGPAGVIPCNRSGAQ